MDTKFCGLNTPQLSEEKRRLFLEDFFSGTQALKAKQPPQQSAPVLRSIDAAQISTKKKVNKLAALTHSSVASVRKKAEQTTQQYDFNLEESKLWDLILAYNTLAQDICSSDLPSDIEEEAVLVKMTQDFADKTLRDFSKTWLSKILEIATYTKKTGFGNCQEKAFYGFAALLLESQKPNSLVYSLRLATFTNHFIVIVNEKILMDPWLNLAFPLNKENLNQNIDYVFNGFGELINYFTFHSNGSCITHQVTEDSRTSERDDSSMWDVSRCIKFLIENQKYFTLPVLQSKNVRKRKERDKDLFLDSGPTDSDASSADLLQTPTEPHDARDKTPADEDATLDSYSSTFFRDLSSSTKPQVTGSRSNQNGTGITITKYFF